MSGSIVTPAGDQKIEKKPVKFSNLLREPYPIALPEDRDSMLMLGNFSRWWTEHV